MNAEDHKMHCVALYGTEPHLLAVGSQVAAAADLLREIGLEPDLAGIMYPGGPRAPFKMRTLQRHLEKAHGKKISAVQFYARQPSYVQLSFGWFATAMFMGDRHPAAVICVPSQRVGVTRLLDTVRQLLFLGKYEYGFAYERSLFRGPTFYAMGMRVGSDPSPEDAEIRRWDGVLRSAHGAGLPLRSVYCTNFLSQSQLKIICNDMTLGEWIVGSRERGSLEPFTESTWKWQLSESQRLVVLSDPAIQDLLSEMSIG